VLGPEHPDTLRAMQNQATAHISQGKYAEAAALFAEGAEISKRLLGPEHPDTLRWTSQLHAYDWQTFDKRSELGGTLAGHKKFAEAEPLLESGYYGMKLREAGMLGAHKARLKEALERLVQLYTDWGQAEKAAQWKEKLDAFNAASTTPTNPAPKP